MELGLSLGEAPKAFPFVGKGSARSKSLGFPVTLRIGLDSREEGVDGEGEGRLGRQERDRRDERTSKQRGLGETTPLQLELLPPAPVPRPSSPLVGLACQGDGEASPNRAFDVNQQPLAEERDDEATVASPNSTVSSFQRDFCLYKRSSDPVGANEVELERTCSRASDEEENGIARKKLRLSKEQSAFLEESFKEHCTLNPKQKLALAKQLNLRPRQVEVWFQNRRARTKLKQTEVDCEYLKRCCETLTEENRRLQKELQELRALKTAHPFSMQLPATTLTMCPSCERVATTTDPAIKTAAFGPAASPKARFRPCPPPHQSAAS